MRRNYTMRILDKESDAHRPRSAVRDDGRRQFIDGDFPASPPGLEAGREGTRLFLRLGVHDRQPRLGRFGALFVDNILEPRQGAFVGALLLERFHLSLADGEDRLDLQQFGQQFLRAANASALGKIFQRGAGGNPLRQRTTKAGARLARRSGEKVGKPVSTRA